MAIFLSQYEYMFQPITDLIHGIDEKLGFPARMEAVDVIVFIVAIVLFGCAVLAHF